MKKGKICILILAVIIVVAIIVAVVVNNNKSSEENSTEYTETEVVKTDVINTVSSSGSVVSALEEKKELHATYYFEEIYFDKNQTIKSGENIIKYTNGTYLTAPYDCVITEESLPSSGEVCTNKHYITIKSTQSLEMSLTVSEDKASDISEGQEAKIKVDALGDEEITGYVTKIDNSATYSSSGSTFGVTVDFENNGKILLGMSATCSIVLDKAENVIAVATEAINTDKGKSTVLVKDSNGSTKTVTVETGISSDAYTEIKSGLNEGDIALIEEDDSSSNSKYNQMGHGMQMQGGSQGGSSEAPSMPGGDSSSGMPSMPSGAGSGSGSQGGASTQKQSN